MQCLPTGGKVTSSRVKLCFPTGGKVTSSRVKLRFPTGGKVTSSRVKLRFPTGGKVASSRVKLHFPIGSACLMSQITRDKLHLPIGSACQMSQQIKSIHIQFDCWIHSKVPKPIAARFGRSLIVACLFNCQARLHQHQSKIKLSHVN